MSRTPQRLKRSELFKLDLFFKEQYVGRSRYGTMGSFYWKIFRNPTQDGIVNLIKENSRIVASTSVTPKTLLLNNNILSAAEIGDTYTHQDYRGQGLFSILINKSREQANEIGVEFIYGTPNKQSLPGYQKRANFEVIESLDVRVLRFQLSVRSVLRSKIGWLLADVLNILFGLFIRGYNSLLSLKALNPKTVSIEENSCLPMDWEKFWNEASKEWDFIFNRNAERMIWRYFENPDIYNFITLRIKGSLVGFVVYKLVSDESGTNLVIADFLCLKNVAGALNHFIMYIKSKGLKMDVRSIVIWCDSSSPYSHIFKKNGFIDVASIPVISFKDNLFEQLKSVNRPHFVMADSDNI